MSVVWSHSALKDYENCPRKYHEVRVLKKHKFEETEQTRYGEQFHKAAEDYLKGKPLPKEFDFIKPTLDALFSKKGVKHGELKMAVTTDLQPCDWFSKKVWVRGIADLIIIDDEDKLAWVVDYKTGSNKYPDRDQLDLMSLLVFAHFPQVEFVNSALVFVIKESMTKHKVTLEDSDSLWWGYRQRVSRIESSLDTGVWNPKQSGLCPWCPVTSCEFNPKH
jgi:hypothetical protein